MPKIFLTGATGFIGGDILYLLNTTHPDWEISALVRNSSKGALVASAYPSIRLVYGDNKASDLLERESASADVVIHAGSSDEDTDAAAAIVKGLQSATRDVGNPSTMKYYIHTSGALLLAGQSVRTKAWGDRFDKVYDDWDGLEDLTKTMADDAPHRAVDQIVLAASASASASASTLSSTPASESEMVRANNRIRTAIVNPAVVYGIGRGPDKKLSWPLWSSMINHKKAFAVGKGENTWHYVHVRDLSKLYLHLVEAAVAELQQQQGVPATDGATTGTVAGALPEAKRTEKDDNLWNCNGYYLAEQGSYVVREMLQRAAEIGHKRKLLPTADVEHISAKEADEILPYARYLLGANSRGKAIRASKLLGWTPTHPCFEEEMESLMVYEAQLHGQIRGHAARVEEESLS